jgi:hypothetical protein
MRREEERWRDAGWEGVMSTKDSEIDRKGVEDV